MSWLYRYEANQLLRYERRVARDYDASLFVSAPEADLFRQLAPESTAKIGHFNNGVDTDYFSPELAARQPVRGGRARAGVHRRDGLLAQSSMPWNGSRATFSRSCAARFPDLASTSSAPGRAPAVQALAQQPRRGGDRHRA